MWRVYANGSVGVFQGFCSPLFCLTILLLQYFPFFLGFYQSLFFPDKQPIVCLLLAKPLFGARCWRNELYCWNHLVKRCLFPKRHCVSAFSNCVRLAQVSTVSFCTSLPTRICISFSKPTRSCSLYYLCKQISNGTVVYSLFSGPCCLAYKASRALLSTA